MSEDKEKQEEDFQNVVKFGTFQLQTKSFWFGIISILAAFLLIIIWLNSYYWYKVITDMNQTNQALIKIIQTVSSHSTSSK